ncbi:MAG: hypothetical protein EBQ63_00140, partial [Actinobacteria bacterium]|nr:hypothetical protein [Actinomycetota bacterium]
YATGAMGIQYLVGTYGFDKLYKFLGGLNAAWKPECKTDSADIVPCPSWKDVFKKTFGVSPENAYTGFGKFIVDQIAWAQKQKIQTDEVLRSKFHKTMLCQNLQFLRLKFAQAPHVQKRMR